ncbi:hypothetical protein FA95DRAFT_1570917 [Auriscalpium vulgare]|uniref:Uncharacterized protein n=1 Tax=Auriscalpium vulgare TaxID=40419 RepID=A0ACB8S1K8_9AGAM|nr:hypothetical protein FA95DRAFT_1570917 [Auriscalpium vulgare]
MVSTARSLRRRGLSTGTKSSDSFEKRLQWSWDFSIAEVVTRGEFNETQSIGGTIRMQAGGETQAVARAQPNACTALSTRANIVLVPTTMRGISLCFVLAGLASAAEVYLSPPVSVAAQLSTAEASALVSRHLQLEQFEPSLDSQALPELFRQPFVGQGSRSGLLLSINEVDARDVISDAFKPSFSLPASSLTTSFSHLISTSLERAPHVYSHVYSEPAHPAPLPRLVDLFSIPSDATERFLSELAALVNFLETDADAPGDTFGAFELRGLGAIAAAHGRASEPYALAAESLRAALHSALHTERLNLALLTHAAGGLARRTPQQSPLPPDITPLPIGSDVQCFTSAEICSNSTSSCSGRGECAAASKLGRTCYVCSCAATKDSKGRTEYWAGSQCERKDVSSSFVLLAGTSIGLLVMVAGSVGLLASMGSMKLPSVLTGTIARDKKND